MTPAVRHALEVVTGNQLYSNDLLHVAYSLANYSKFFSLYSTAPNMSDYLMDLMASKLRRNSISVLSDHLIRSDNC